MNYTKLTQTTRYLLYAFFAANIAIMTGFWWQGSGVEMLRSGSGLLRGIGRVTGLYAAFAMIVDFALIARVPVVEQTLGRIWQLKLHKWFGNAAFYLVFAHIIFLVIGYALPFHFSFVHEFLDFTFNYPDVLQAVVATVLLVAVVVLSVSFVIRRVKYETWYFVHLLSYLVILLGFAHQLSTGVDFVGRPVFVAYWYALYIALIVIVVGFRFVRPLWISFRHDLRVDRVESETPHTYSIYLRGRNLDRLKYKGGQFAIWRFMDSKRWWQGHPFSYSSLPGQSRLRLTYKKSGDFTNHLDQVKPGTRVLMDGAYGIFTAERAIKPKLLLIAGGIGVTPFISLLPDAIGLNKDIVMLYAVRTSQDLAFRRELEASGIKLTFIVSNQPDYEGETGVIGIHKLKHLVPDASDREVFLCGPPAMMKTVETALVSVGVPTKLIHTEDFTFNRSARRSG